MSNLHALTYLLLKTPHTAENAATHIGVLPCDAVAVDPHNGYVAPIANDVLETLKGPGEEGNAYTFVMDITDSLVPADALNTPATPRPLYVIAPIDGPGDIPKIDVRAHILDSLRQERLGGEYNFNIDSPSPKGEAISLATADAFRPRTWVGHRIAGWLGVCANSHYTTVMTTQDGEPKAVSGELIPAVGYLAFVDWPTYAAVAQLLDIEPLPQNEATTAPYRLREALAWMQQSILSAWTIYNTTELFTIGYAQVYARQLAYYVGQLGQYATAVLEAPGGYVKPDPKVTNAVTAAMQMINTAAFTIAPQEFKKYGPGDTEGPESLSFAMNHTHLPQTYEAFGQAIKACVIAFDAATACAPIALQEMIRQQTSELGPRWPTVPQQTVEHVMQ